MLEKEKNEVKLILFYLKKKKSFWTLGIFFYQFLFPKYPIMATNKKKQPPLNMGISSNPMDYIRYGLNDIKLAPS